MLSFDTYNYLVHYFGQPQGSMADDPNGTLGGDYEFVISDATADRIELKGKKYGNRIVMKAFSADQTWKQYLTRIKKVSFMNTTCGWTDSTPGKCYAATIRSL